MAELLTSIQTGSGTPVFESLSIQELQQRVDDFTSNALSNTVSLAAPAMPSVSLGEPAPLFSLPAINEAAGFFSFSNDIMVVSSTGGPSAIVSARLFDITSYDYYQKGTYPSIETKLRYNYNMTTASVDTTFTNILNNITQELRPPKTSTTFTYDFKFSQNRNGTLSGSSGGGY